MVQEAMFSLVGLIHDHVRFSNYFETIRELIRRSNEVVLVVDETNCKTFWSIKDYWVLLLSHQASDTHTVVVHKHTGSKSYGEKTY